MCLQKGLQCRRNRTLCLVMCAVLCAVVCGCECALWCGEGPNSSGDCLTQYTGRLSIGLSCHGDLYPSAAHCVNACTLSKCNNASQKAALEWDVVSTDTHPTES